MNRTSDVGVGHTATMAFESHIDTSTMTSEPISTMLFDQYGRMQWTDAVGADRNVGRMGTVEAHGISMAVDPVRLLRLR